MKRTNLQVQQKFASSSPKRSGTLKIGEVSKQSGVNIETLRFYEKAGLLDKPARSMSSNYRLYDSEVLERLDFIKRAQTLGFTLEEIRQVINHKREGESPCAEVRGIVRRRLAELDEKMRQMRLYRDELAETLDEWDKQREAEGHVCGLIEGLHIEHKIDAKKELSQRKK